MTDFHVGQKVRFGRTNGEKTLGEIVKLNPKKAKVKTLEERGGFFGQIWNVPYSMLQPVDGPVVKEKLVFSPFAGNDNLILSAILGCYVELSPENLWCDGEASASHVSRTRTELNRKLKGLYLALGREVSESEIYEWDDSRRKQQRAV